MTDSGAPMEPRKDLWTPQERAARTVRRKARQQEAEAFAALLVKHGKLPVAAREMWPGLEPDKARSKARSLVRTRTFQEAQARTIRRVEQEVGVTPEWIVRKLVIQAETAPKSSDRIRALELLGRHLGMFVERKEVRSLSVEVQSMTTEELHKLLARELGTQTPHPGDA